MENFGKVYHISNSFHPKKIAISTIFFYRAKARMPYNNTQINKKVYNNPLFMCFVTAPAPRMLILANQEHTNPPKWGVMCQHRIITCRLPFTKFPQFQNRLILTLYTSIA